MKKLLVLLLPLTAFVAGCSCCSTASKSKTQALFNGRDLSGWVVMHGGEWKIEDGVLVGRNGQNWSTNPEKSGSWLRTEKSYGDFVLESDVRFPNDIDSGFMWGKPELQVQIGVSRSLKVDMTGSIYYKGKYPEEARAKGVDKLLKLNDWNTLRIEFKGKTTKVWLNGQHVLTWDCPDETKPAPIGLQIHPGVDMKVEFKNLKVAELK